MLRVPVQAAPQTILALLPYAVPVLEERLRPQQIKVRAHWCTQRSVCTSMLVHAVLDRRQGPQHIKVLKMRLFLECTCTCWKSGGAVCGMCLCIRLSTCNVRGLFENPAHFP